MLRTLDVIRLVHVIGLDPDLEKLLEKELHDLGIVIDTLQKNALVSKRNTGVREKGKSPGGFFRDLVRVVEMHINVKRMKTLEHRDKLRGHSLREEPGHARPDPENLQMWYSPQLSENVLQFLVREQEGISTRDNDIPDLLMLPDISNPVFNVSGIDLACITYFSFPRAETAVSRTYRGNEKQNPVRIPVNDTVYRRIVVLCKRIIGTGIFSQFRRAGNPLPGKRVPF